MAVIAAGQHSKENEPSLRIALEDGPESNSEHLNEVELSDFLKTQHTKSPDEVAEYRRHLAECKECWDVWNQVRWNAAQGGRAFNELKAYLGPKFQHYFDSSWALADDWNAQQPNNPDEVTRFYKQTPHYLYNLVIWYDSGDRFNFIPYFEKLREQFGIQSVLDYGCGVGNDGLALLEAGFEVTFVDFVCPSTDFLRWRLARRGFQDTFMDVETLPTLPPADMLIAIDVLEHMVDPLTVVEKLHPSTKIFAHKSQFGKTEGGRHPFHFDFDENQLNDRLRAEGFRPLDWPESQLSIWVRDVA